MLLKHEAAAPHVFTNFMTRWNLSPSSAEKNGHMGRLWRWLLQPIFTFIVRRQPLVAIVIMIGAKEEARWRSKKNKKVHICRRVDGWVKQTQDFHPEDRCLCPVTWLKKTEYQFVTCDVIPGHVNNQSFKIALLYQYVDISPHIKGDASAYSLFSL